MQISNSLESLDLILKDVESEHEKALDRLEAYAVSCRKEEEDETHLNAAVSLVKRLRSVFYVLELKGCQRLTLDVLALLKRITRVNTDSRLKLLEIVTGSLMRVMKYVRYINRKPVDLPELMLPGINELRSSINVEILPESFFFKVDYNKPRPHKKINMLFSEEDGSTSRHIRQMYQIGLIEVLRRTNVVGGLKMMKNAITKLDAECARPTSPNMWWVAEGVLENFISGGVKLTMPRVKIFSRLDRQMKNLAMVPPEPPSAVKRELKELGRELLFISSITNSRGEVTLNILKHFELVDSTLTEGMLRREATAITGPSEQDYSSLADALLKEIDSIEATLAEFMGEMSTKTGIAKLTSKMTNLNSLLKILQIDDHVVRLAVAIDSLEKIGDEHRKIADPEIEVLVNIVGVVKETFSEPDFINLSNHSKGDRETLSAELREVRVRSHRKINLLIKEFTEFTNKDRRVLLLKNIPSMLTDLKQEFNTLNVKGSDKIFDSSVTFVNKYLVRSPSKTSDKAINLFADIIGSLEFYLETLKFTASPSPRIIQFAEDSLESLSSMMSNVQGGRL